MQHKELKEKGACMQYSKEVEYARYIGSGFRDLATGRVYKVIIHRKQLSTLEKIGEFLGFGDDKPLIRVTRWLVGGGLGTSIQYRHQGFFESDWRMEPNWLQMSQNRKKRGARK